MLAVTLELLSVFAKDALEHSGSDYGVILVPHLVEEFGVGLNQSATSAQGVLLVQVIFESLVDEILCELPTVTQALQTAIHIAGVAQITKANFPVSSCGASLEASNTLLELRVSLSPTGRLMPPLVLLEAQFAAVSHSLACAFNFQYLLLCAKLALSDVDALVLHESKRESLLRCISELHNDV